MLRFFIVLIIFNMSNSKLLSQDEHNEYKGHHCFNQHDSFSLGGGVPFSLHFEIPGVNLRGYYNINHNICFGPEVSYFKQDDLGVFDLDFVGHYIFELPWIGIYPVVGVNFTNERSAHDTNEGFGALFGGGIHRNHKRFTFFTEYTHVQGVLTDDFITAGILYTL